MVGDVIYDEVAGLSNPLVLHDLEDPARVVPFGPLGAGGAAGYDREERLLVPMIDRGQLVPRDTSLATARRRVREQLAQLSPRTRRFLNPQPHPVGLDPHVHHEKRRLIEAARARVLAHDGNGNGSKVR